jgi:hypothetical protein
MNENNPRCPWRVARGLQTESGIMNGIDAMTEADAMVFVLRKQSATQFATPIQRPLQCTFGAIATI